MTKLNRAHPPAGSRVITHKFKILDQDEALLRQLLNDEGVTFQWFLDCVVQSYLRGDPQVTQIVRQFKALMSVPKERRDLYQLSVRDREKLYEDLEKLQERKSLFEVPEPQLGDEREQDHWARGCSCQNGCKSPYCDKL